MLNNYSEVGRCGYYVRMALEAGGINTNSHPVPARLYGSYLKNWGFSKVNTDKFERGDIAVFQGYPGATADKNGVPYGHIQIYNGNQWMAVWHQNGFWPGRGYSVNKASFEIYRWNK
nr:hypothetical protein [uncultured Flavobacterium sp.]